MSTPSNPIKITFLTYKLPSITPTEFRQRWTYHGQETAKILKNHGCSEYTQCYVGREGVERLGGLVSGGARRGLVGWDGVGNTLSHRVGDQREGEGVEGVEGGNGENGGNGGNRVEEKVVKREEDRTKWECDGIATMVFKNWEGVEGFLKDEENRELARRDVPHFTDYSRRKMIVGDEVVFLRDGVVR